MKNTQTYNFLEAIDQFRKDKPNWYRKIGATLKEAFWYANVDLSYQSTGRRAREAVNLGLLSVELRDTKNAKGVAHYKLTREGAALLRRKA